MFFVAPLVGAWIEMSVSSFSIIESFKSLLSWERGLKLYSLFLHWSNSMSLLSWERGLKLEQRYRLNPAHSVAPLVGAWIEILLKIKITMHMIRRSSRGSVDWNITTGEISDNSSVAPLVGAWIEILIISPLSTDFFVAPLVGAWIEIKLSQTELPEESSLLSWERGLKYTRPTKGKQQYSRSSRGSVDWNLNTM